MGPGQNVYLYVLLAFFVLLCTFGNFYNELFPTFPHNCVPISQPKSERVQDFLCETTGSFSVIFVSSACTAICVPWHEVYTCTLEHDAVNVSIILPTKSENEGLIVNLLVIPIYFFRQV